MTAAGVGEALQPPRVPYVNPALRKLYYRTIDKTPERREKKRIACLNWKRANIEYARAADRARWALTRQPGLSWIDREEILQIYFLAVTATKLFGEPYEVDHIVPVRSKLVCGLHVPWNLQIIKRSENRARGNRSWPDMPDPVSRETTPRKRKKRAKSAT